MSTRLIVVLPSTKTGYFDGSEITFSEIAREKFQLIQGEMNEAGKCFALGRYTACVFHLMRVMEQTVKKLGTKFNIPSAHKKTWGNILRKIKEKIDTMSDDTPARKIKKQRYYRTHDLLHSVCEGIRNPLVHPVITNIDSIYTEEDARNIINRVMVFVNDFAQLR